MKSTLAFFFFFSSFLLYTPDLDAQSRTKWSLAFSLDPTFSACINTSTSNETVPGTGSTYRQYNDSVSRSETYRFNVVIPTAWFNYSLNQNWELQAGIGYLDVGFQRQRKHIQISEPLYPGIGNGILTELSNSEKSIDFDYRYQYLHVPVLFNHRLGRSRDYKFTFSYTAGVAIDVLLKHKITAYLNDFTVDDQKTFQLDSTGYGAKPVVLNIILGGRIDYRIDKKLSLMIQPVIGFYPVPVSSGPIDVYPVYFSVNTGLVFDMSR